MTATPRKLGRVQPLITIERETPDQPEVASFLEAADKRADTLYALQSRYGSGLPALLLAGVRYFVARECGQALGGGGYVRLAEDKAEMKRLFVDPNARGRGIGGSIVHAIERAAVKEGVQTLFLETGIKSAEALALHRKLGFQERPSFGNYEHDPLSVFMMKQLTLPKG